MLFMQRNIWDEEPCLSQSAGLRQWRKKVGRASGRRGAITCLPVLPPSNTYECSRHWFRPRDKTVAKQTPQIMYRDMKSK